MIFCPGDFSAEDPVRDQHKVWIFPAVEEAEEHKNTNSFKISSVAILSSYLPAFWPM